MNNTNSLYKLYRTLLPILGVLLVFISPASFAAEIKTVQTGLATISGKSETVPITSVVDNKSLLIFNLTTNSTSAGPQDTHLRGQLNCSGGSCNGIDFKRFGNGGSVTVRWQVMEFTSASTVTVQRGIETQSSMAGALPQKTISTGVDSSKSFVLLSEFVHGSVTSDDDFTRGQINASGDLVLSVGEKKPVSFLAEMAWQVVEYQDAIVQRGDVVFSTSDVAKTVAISALDLGKSLLFYNYYSTGKSSDNPVCQNVVSGAISSSTSLQFNRGCANHNGEIHLSWFAVEFTDATLVQHNVASFGSSQTTKTITLNNTVDPSCAITSTGYHQRGGQSVATVDHTSSAWFNAELNAAGSNLTLSRGQTNSATAEVGWFVAEFEGCGATPSWPTPPVTGSGNGSECVLTHDENPGVNAEPHSFYNIGDHTNPNTLTKIGPWDVASGTVEGLTADVANGVFYALNANRSGTLVLGKIDFATGSFTDITVVGASTISHSVYGSLSIVEARAIAHQPNTNEVWIAAYETQPSTGLGGSYGYLFKMNVTTGNLVTGAFAGEDYLAIDLAPYDLDGTGTRSTIEALTFYENEPNILYGVVSTNRTGSSSNIGHLFAVDVSQANPQAILAPNNLSGMTYSSGDAAPASAYYDIEGMAFDPDGDLVIISANVGGANANSLSTVDLATGIAGNTHGIISGDWEGIVCALDYPSNSDYGDAPIVGTAPDGSGTNNYGTASHTIVSGTYLGVSDPDVDSANQPTANADGDDVDGTDDEDGISAFPTLAAGDTSYTLPATNITASGSGTLHGWIDFDGNGTFDSDEHHSVTVINGTLAASLSWAFTDLMSTGTTFARLRFTSDSSVTASTPSSAAIDGEVEDYNTVSITAQPSCSALSGDINGGLSTTTKLATGDTVFLASSTLASETGHLKAYRVDSNGLPETEVWDAATAMATQDERTTRLFSTASDGTKLLFSSLDNAFLSSGTPDGQTIKNTIAAALMGTISPQSNVAAINDAMNAGFYLTNNTYKTFYSTTVSKRAATNGASKPSRILVSSDDGFLYAFDQYNGELGWGWMPRTVAQALHMTNFSTNHLMQGNISVMDIKSANGYDSYVVGSYKNGLGHYVLKLGSDSRLDAVMWDTDHTTDTISAISAPNQGQPAYFSDVSGTLYMTYVMTDAANVSTLHIRNVIDASVHEKIPLTFTATSEPYVMRDFGSTYAPTKKTLYLGDSAGNIHAAGLLTVSGAVGMLETTSTIMTELNNTTVAALNTTDSSPVLFIGAAGSSTSRTFYLHAQSSDRFTIFQYDANNNTWQADWTSYIGGAGAWLNGSSSLTAKATIQSLPIGAILTDNAFVVANSIVLPVSLPSSSNGCYNEAFYYFYKLVDGSIPTQTFLKTSDKTFIGGSISLGNGNARTLQMSKLKGKYLRLGFGMADQKTDVTTVSGINKTFYINEPSAKVLRGRKELRK